MSKEQPIPLAITGLVDEINLFVDDNGEWEEHAYVPGYIRRYPFAFATETGGERLALVMDAAYEGVSKDAEMKFFDKGEPTEIVQQSLDFCQRYEQDRRLTEEAMKVLIEHDLIDGQAAQYLPTGQTEQRTFAQYFGIVEKRVQDLPDDKFLELRKAGLLPLIYSHLLSLGNWRSIMLRRARRYNLTDDTLLEPIKRS